MEKSSSDDLDRFSRYWSESELMLKVYLAGVIYNRSDAQDILQKVAICAFRKFAQYNPELPFKAWVMKITKFEILAYFRDRGRKHEVVDTEVAEQMACRIEDKASEISDLQARQAAAIEQAVTELPQRQREILKLKYYSGLSSDDIAVKLQMQPGAVRTALTRIRIKLKKAIDGLGIDDK